MAGLAATSACDSPNARCRTSSASRNNGACWFCATPPDDTGAVEAPVRFVPPDVHTNRFPREGRLVVIVMDRSIGNGAPLQAARAIASADLAGVVYTASGLRMNSQGLTNS